LVALERDPTPGALAACRHAGFRVIKQKGGLARTLCLVDPLVAILLDRVYPPLDLEGLRESLRRLKDLGDDVALFQSTALLSSEPLSRSDLRRLLRRPGRAQPWGAGLVQLQAATIVPGYQAELRRRGYRVEKGMVEDFAAVLHDRVDPPLTLRGLRVVLWWLEHLGHHGFREERQRVLLSTAALSTAPIPRDELLVHLLGMPVEVRVRCA
jgi:hypothetical protein